MKNKNSNPKIFITTNGCIRRAFDLTRLKKYFELNNCTLVKSPKKANYLILITCSVKQNKEQESLRLIKKYKKYSGELIVAGCLPDIAPAKFKAQFAGRYFTSKNLAAVDSLFPDFKIKLADVPRDPMFATSSPFKDPFKIRLAKKIKNLIQPTPPPSHAYLTIGVGCTGNCSYCSVHKSFEPFQSKPLKECCAEYQKLIDSGYRSFTIMSPDTGSYGIDMHSSLPELLDKFAEMNKGLDIKWYVIDLKPCWILKYKDEFIKHLQADRIHHLLVPIQSASPRLLRLMHRYDKIDNIAETLKEFKKIKPDLELRTHMMIGFPSETEQDFSTTLDFVASIPFNHADLLKYYDASGTKSSQMTDKVPDKVAIQRIRQAVKFLKAHDINYDCDDI